MESCHIKEPVFQIPKTRKKNQSCRSVCMLQSPVPKCRKEPQRAHAPSSQRRKELSYPLSVASINGRSETGVYESHLPTCFQVSRARGQPDFPIGLVNIPDVRCPVSHKESCMPEVLHAVKMPPRPRGRLDLVLLLQCMPCRYNASKPRER